MGETSAPDAVISFGGKGQRNEARVRFHTRTANTQRFNKVGPNQRRQQSTGSFKNET